MQLGSKNFGNAKRIEKRDEIRKLSKREIKGKGRRVQKFSKLVGGR